MCLPLLFSNVPSVLSPTGALCEASSSLMQSLALLLLIAVAMRSLELSAQCCWNSLQSFLSLSSLLSLKSSFEHSFLFFIFVHDFLSVSLQDLTREFQWCEFDWMFVLSGFWLGIELDKPSGKNDGSVGGVRYFKCPSKHGVFAPPSRVQRYVSSVHLTGFAPKSSSTCTLNKTVYHLLVSQNSK